ncbi:hypothetical protein RR46_03280 [Papilio xuthus]|uniref:Uncharacterized protein n=1 Tax=Papilio xuthus TaxID=66420 RepID=A0A194QGX3_PAPXU|nr:hypothetical protein RR46_03280 [Papilio xuthus]
MLWRGDTPPHPTVASFLSSTNTYLTSGGGVQEERVRYLPALNTYNTLGKPAAAGKPRQAAPGLTAPRRSGADDRFNQPIIYSILLTTFLRYYYKILLYNSGVRRMKTPRGSAERHLPPAIAFIGIHNRYDTMF